MSEESCREKAKDSILYEHLHTNSLGLFLNIAQIQSELNLGYFWFYKTMSVAILNPTNFDFWRYLKGQYASSSPLCSILYVISKNNLIQYL